MERGAKKRNRGEGVFQRERERREEGAGSADPELYMLPGSGGGSVPMVTFSLSDL